MRTCNIGNPPRFSCREQDEFLAISDGDCAVALLHRPTLSLEMREFYPDGRANATFEVERPYHWPSFRGTRLTVCWWIGAQAVCSSRNEIEVSEGGAELWIRIREEFGPDESGEHELRFGFDDALGCYTVEIRATLALLRPALVEVSNFHAQGVGHAWRETAKLSQTFWTNAEGGVTRFHHNPLLPNTPGDMDVLSRRRVPVGGMLGFGAQLQSNPALDILRSHTSALAFATCSNSYDEHFFLGCPLPMDEEGKYRWDVTYRLISLPQERAQALLSQAQPLDLNIDADSHDSWQYLDALRLAGRQAQPLEGTLPFELGVINSCDTALDPSLFLPGNYWVFMPQPYGAVAWDRSVGHGDTSSIRMTGRVAQAKLEATTQGPSLMIEQGQRYEFSAWVKTQLQEGVRAWLQVEAITFSRADCSRLCKSREVSGSSEWQRLEVEIAPQHPEAFLVVSLHLEGEGSAWFDDIALMGPPKSYR